MEKITSLLFTFLVALSLHSQNTQQVDTLPTPTPKDWENTTPKEQIKEPRMIEVDPSPRRFPFYTSGQSSSKTRYRSSSDIKTLSNTSSHRGGFGALTFRATSFRDESMVLAGVKGGWIISRSLALGFEGQGIIPTVKFNDIANPSGKQVVAIGGYGGFFLEPIFFSNEVIHITFPVSAGAGWLGYQDDWEDHLLRPNNNGWAGLIDQDLFWYIEPGAALELNVARNFRINFAVSKRFVDDLKLIDTSDTAFSTWNYVLTLKIGRF